MKEHLTLHRLRTILAILIALSLAVAPLASAWAGAPTTGATSVNMASEDGAVMDCAKMGMAAEKSGTDFDCPCCDTKSKCADMTACLMKCSTQVIGIVMPAVRLAAIIGHHDRPADPQEPPDWSMRPPAPPPRA